MLDPVTMIVWPAKDWVGMGIDWRWARRPASPDDIFLLSWGARIKVMCQEMQRFGSDEGVFEEF